MTKKTGRFAPVAGMSKGDSCEHTRWGIQHFINALNVIRKFRWALIELIIGGSPLTRIRNDRNMKAQFTIGVFGMIFDERGRVLLCHRKDHDLWNLPGGALESGEAPWDGVKREVKEETGLIVDVSKLTGVYSKPDKDDIVLSFLCTRTGGEITLNDEADKIEYFEIDKLPSNTVPKQVE